MTRTDPNIINDFISTIIKFYEDKLEPHPEFDENVINHFETWFDEVVQSDQKFSGGIEQAHSRLTVLKQLEVICSNEASSKLGQLLKLKFSIATDNKIEAVNICENLINANSDDNVVVSNVLKIMLRAQYFSEAKHLLLKHVKIIRDKELTLAATIQILTAEEKFSSVWSLLKKLNMDAVGETLLRAIINFYLKSNNHLLAYKKLQKLTGKYPNDIQLHETLLDLAIETRDFEAAHNIFKKFQGSGSITIKMAGAELTLAEGNLQQASDQFHELVMEDNANMPAFFGWVKSTKFSINPEVENIINAGPTTLHSELYHFSAAKYFDDIGDINSSLKFLKRGNAIKKALLKYDKNYDKKLFEILGNMSSFLAKRITEQPSCDVNRLFIVGLPRSGTTLLEQLLTQHSMISSSGELEFLNLIIGKSLSSTVNVTDATLNYIKNQYDEMISMAGFETSDVSIDKMPLNFRWVYLILASMPDSKIINIKRNRVAQTWALYKQFFQGEGNSFAYSIDDINFYIDLYLEFINQASLLFPERILNIQYEVMVEEPENTLSSIYKFINVPNEQGAINFYKSPSHVLTASATQVRQPIYNNANNHYESYQKLMDVTQVQHD